MYNKYYTDALVLASRERGEADRILTIYTKDFGLVRARATGVRSETSRMRYALQHYARVAVSLIRGKQGWRLAGASLERAAGSTENTKIFARISTLTERLVQGEEANPLLFSVLSDAHEALMAPQNSSDAATSVEILCVARVLHALGYLSHEALETVFFTHTDYSLESLRVAESEREELLNRINKAIAEAQL